MGTRHAITNSDYTQPPLPVELALSAIEQHIDHRGHSEQAVALYAGRLAWFLRWLRLEPGRHELLPTDFVDFHSWLGKIRAKRLNKPLDHETQKEILKRLRSALRWAYGAGRLAHDYSSWVPPINYGAIQIDPNLLFDDEEDPPPVIRACITSHDLPSVATVRAWLEIFLASKQLRGLSPATLRDYAIRIGYYLDFATHNGLSASVLSTATIELYLMQRRASVSPFTEHGDFATLRNFCGWLVKRHYLEASPMLDLERPKKPRKRMRAVTYAQYRELYTSIQGDDWMARRDRLILTILFFSGLRASELVKLQIADIEQDGMIYIREGKGGRDRLVPYHPDVPFLLKSYLALRPPTESPYLLMSSNGSGGIRGVMQYAGLQQMLRRRCQAAGLPRYNLHSFRHGFAIAFLNADMQMSAVSAAMGHTSMDTTQIYARWNTTGLRTAYLAALARLA